MAVYTPLEGEEIAALCRAFSLGHAVSVEPVTGGTENTTYRLVTPEGPFALTLVESQDEATLSARLAWVAELYHNGLPVPLPRHHLNGGWIHSCRGKPVVISPWLAGRVINRPDTVQCAAVGEALARLHNHGGTHLSNHETSLTPWLEAAEGLSLSAKERHLLGAARHLARELSLEDLPGGCIHGDLFRDNVLFEGSRITAILDFYAAGRGPWLLDLAIATIDWCRSEDDRLDPRRCAALLDGYGKWRPLTRGERESWTAALCHAAAGFWAMRRVTRERLRPGLVRLKDPDEMARLASLLFTLCP